MSKSYHNAIYLSDPPDVIASKVAGMITDPQRIRINDPGNPDVCNVFEFHKVYSDKETVDRINTECRNAQIGCVECKQIMAQCLIKALEPIRRQRAHYEARPDLVADIIASGSLKATAVSQQTMAEVRAAMKI